MGVFCIGSLRLMYASALRIETCDNGRIVLADVHGIKLIKNVFTAC